jgi:DNA-binding NarL/FixJ family response regulator
MPRTLRQGVPASVLVILVASLATVPAGPSACQEKNDLTPRQRQVMNLVLAGHPSKNIAADLKISRRTVENHRAAIMQRTGATSLPALARIAVGASVYADQRLRHGLRILPDLRA